MKSQITLKLILREKIIIESLLLTILIGLIGLLSYIILPKIFVLVWLELQHFVLPQFMEYIGKATHIL